MTIKGALALAALGAALFVAQSARADDDHTFTAMLDLRLVSSDATTSFIRDGGLGLTRFDEDHEGLRLGRMFLEYRGRLSDTLDARVVLDSYLDGDKNPVDISEAFLQWRPWPQNAWRWRVRAGAFYPAISFENTAPGWNSAYTLSSSAINTWLGEEIRAIGAEVNATWLGTRAGYPVDVSLIGGLYGWNDPAGVVIFQRGWGLHDRQTALFGGVEQAFYPNGTSRPQLELFHEIDHRAGFYAGAQVAHPAGVTLRFMHYDNRGDPGAENAYEYAWLTRFNSAGLQVQAPHDWTFMAQWMAGYTSVGESPDSLGRLASEYDAWFVLASRGFGKHRLSARHDDFYSTSVRGANLFDNWQDGRADTLAYLYTHDKHWQLVIESMRIDSRVRQRTLLGLPVRAVEKTHQLAVRYTF